MEKSISVKENSQKEGADSSNDLVITSEDINNDSDLMCIYKKLVNCNQAISSAIEDQNPDKTEILRRIQIESRKISGLLPNLKEGIIDCYATIESELAERKLEEPDIYSLNSNIDSNIEEEKKEKEVIPTNIYSNNDDELDRVSEQFNGMIRLVLPAKRQTFRMKIFTIIKNFIGKDLTKFSLPIYLNEPLSLLQRMSEMAKNICIMNIAVKFKDPLLRLAYIGLWAATSFAGTRKRLYKPFNPLLGETFELVGSNFRLFGEQFSHHPPIGVICIEVFSCNIHEEKYLLYKIRVNTNVKTAFWGKYVDIILKSPVVIDVIETGEVFECWMPRASVHNIIIGKMYIDQNGILKVVNRNTGHALDLEINGFSGWFKKNDTRGSVYGQVKTPSIKNPQKQKVRIEIKGNWDRELAIRDYRSQTNNFVTVWKADPEPENWDDLYRFSIFTLQLNKLTPEMAKLLPPTDCRFRPDQRALENGDLDFATTEKT